MIIEALVSVVTAIIKFPFGLFNFPTSSGLASIIDVLDLALSTGINFVLFIIPASTILSGIAVFLVLHNAQHIIAVFYAILKKIPFLGLE